MKMCNVQANDQALKGGARKTFMSGCLSGKTSGLNEQQKRMKTCNARANGQALKGDPRKAFMSTCLSNH